MEFGYRITGSHGRTYVNVSMEYNGKVYAEECRIYWFGFTRALDLVKIRILKRILKDIQ